MIVHVPLLHMECELDAKCNSLLINEIYWGDALDGAGLQYLGILGFWGDSADKVVPTR